MKESNTMSHKRKPTITGADNISFVRDAIRFGNRGDSHFAMERISIRNCTTFGGCAPSRVTSPKWRRPERYGALVRSIHGSARAAITPAATNESWKLESVSDDGFHRRIAKAAREIVLSNSTRRNKGRAHK